MYRYKLMIRKAIKNITPFGIVAMIENAKESARIEQQLDDALIDNTLIYRMWADEFGTPFDKAVMQFHRTVESFNKTVQKVVGK